MAAGVTVRRAAAWRPDVVLSIAAPAVVLAVAGYQRRWMSDDGFINLRVLENLLNGHGPVFNAGERVEAATSPLWIALLAVGKTAFGVRSEWVAVAFGVVLSAAGVVAAGCGALVAGRRRGRHVWLPVGALVFLALPPAWDFVTSGLDGSLALAWIGLSFLLLAQVGYRPTWAVALGAAFVVGLAPLVRPDLTVVGAVMFVALLAMEWRRGWRRVVFLVAVGGLAPVAYEVFRMGYYGVVVPNTALAKEASQFRWDQGWAYLHDLVGAYGLGLPLWAAVGAAVVAGLAAAAQRVSVVPQAAMLVGGLLHGAYVVAVGGDFMSGRLLLPTVFLLTAPASVVAVPVPRRARALAGTALSLAPVAVVAGWAWVCVHHYHLPYKAVGPRGIADERAYYAKLAQHDNPLEVEDYKRVRLYEMGERGERMAVDVADGGLPRLCLNAFLLCTKPLPVLSSDWAGSTDGALVAGNVGVAGFRTPLNVHLVDSGGLGDPFVARVKLHRRNRPGHEKGLPDDWLAARFADPDSTLPTEVSRESVDGSRRVLECPALRELDEAVRAPMTFGRFVKNFFGALRRTRLRFDVVGPKDCSAITQ